MNPMVSGMLIFSTHDRVCVIPTLFFQGRRHGVRPRLGAMTTLAALRRFLFAILAMGMAGAVIELLLLKHVDGAIQLVPVALLALGLVTLSWHAIRADGASAGAMRAVMLAFVAAGAAGIYFHYRTSVEFQLESDPALKGSALLWQVLEAKVPPALAPGLMVQLGLIGLAYTYRYKER